MKPSREDELYRNGRDVGYKEGYQAGLQEGYANAVKKYEKRISQHNRHIAKLKLMQLLILAVAVLVMLYFRIPLSQPITLLAFTYLAHGLVTCNENIREAEEDMKIERQRKRDRSC